MMTPHPWSVPAPVEADRVRDVERLGMLDSPPEDRFDQVTSMARRVLGVPAASLSLMDDDRQWMKSIRGLDIDEARKVMVRNCPDYWRSASRMEWKWTRL